MTKALTKKVIYANTGSQLDATMKRRVEVEPKDAQTETLSDCNLRKPTPSSSQSQPDPSHGQPESEFPASSPNPTKASKSTQTKG